MYDVHALQQQNPKCYTRSEPLRVMRLLQIFFSVFTGFSNLYLMNTDYLPKVEMNTYMFNRTWYICCYKAKERVFLGPLPGPEAERASPVRAPRWVFQGTGQLAWLKNKGKECWRMGSLGEVTAEPNRSSVCGSCAAERAITIRNKSVH